MKVLFRQQQNFYKSGLTRSVNFRINQLTKLKEGILVYEKEILDALQKDLGKPHFEGYATEVGFVLDSISDMIKHLPEWSKDQHVKTPLHQPMAKSYYKYDPYGTVLIVAPFNYPFQLLIEPLIGAMAAGNTAILKPSEYTPYTEAVILKLISKLFDPNYIAVVTGGREATTELINLPFDYIFFTGSVPVGKVVMRAAAENLVPVTLELGGKSPVIVHKDAHVKVAAKRIAWGKFMNAGQICVAPDYVYVHKSIEKAFIDELTNVLVDFYGIAPIKSPDYCRIVNERHFDRITALIDHSKVIIGGQYDRAERFIAPTVMKGVEWSDAVMKDEIFGPVLPLLTYENLEEVIDEVRAHPKPLAFYVFSENEKIQDLLMEQIAFGGGCINDTISHVASSSLPFGGVGHSGMGSYHGHDSFLTFSHRKSILKKSTKLDLSLIYPPYKNNIKWVKKLLK
ncbi:aldehyde dehydrogenase [Fusibacter sp. 3D3]|uniref:aldehyde dehydrogenase n=1 Tax=Fusibacter sp. 3D3 TaxID=1048380 RepID=UPI0008536B2D|nr:aldehyde dehydrogenase [Fusibacter sp. 3D3]GAU77951.1 aldehyde dehydrogenase [Fusibacter sp. 3D3]